MLYLPKTRWAFYTINRNSINNQTNFFPSLLVCIVYRLLITQTHWRVSVKRSPIIVSRTFRPPPPTNIKIGHLVPGAIIVICIYLFKNIETFK